MQTRKQAERDAKGVFRLCLVNGSLDEARVRLVVQQVIAAGRTSGLGLLSRFHRLVRLDRARHSARVDSAEPLPGDVREGLEAALVRLHGPDLATSFTDDSTLIGGVRIQVGSDIYDGSVKGRLDALASRF